MSSEWPVSVGQRRLSLLRRYGFPETRLSTVLSVVGDGTATPISTYEVLQRLSRFHAILRSTIEKRGSEFVQIVHDVCCMDYREFRTESASKDELEGIYHDFIEKSTPLSFGPLWRFWNVTTRTGFYFLFSIDHVVADGISVDVFWRSFTSALSGDLHGEDRGFLEYCKKQRQSIAEGHFDEYQEDICKHFRGLRIKSWRKSVRARGEVLSRVIPGEVSTAITYLARSYGVSEFTLWLAVFASSVSGVTGEEAMVVGVPSGNRGDTYGNSIGYFSNILLVPLWVDPDERVRKLVERVWRTWLRVQRTDSVPFDVVLTEVTEARNGFGRYMLNYQYAHSGLRLERFQVASAQMKVAASSIDADLFLSVTRDTTGSRGRLLCRSGAGRDGEGVIAGFGRTVRAMLLNDEGAKVGGRG